MCFLIACVVVSASSFSSGNEQPPIDFSEYYSLEMYGIEKNFIALFFGVHPYPYGEKLEDTIRTVLEELGVDDHATLKTTIARCVENFERSDSVKTWSDDHGLKVSFRYRFKDAVSEHILKLRFEDSGRLIVTISTFKTYTHGITDPYELAD
ncbi:MAG: hypothetical protein DRP71_06950 [Verrucomicrobia bacterium]|nr:MAG: hypothetical protein DRP71_06950 [Verrucomicrobiota bacterium]